MFDLDAYLDRIGYEGPRTPTLETLRGLHARHPDAIPFENLTPLLGQTVSLDIGDIAAKLVGAHRGGYCYEHGHLFRTALETIGFQTVPLAARVLWGPPRPALPPRNHMLLLVDVGGARWIADVGFGGVTLSAPLRLEAGIAQETPHETFRLNLLEGGDWLLQVQLGERWQDVYRFDLTPQHDADYAVSNFYVNAHPESLFVNQLMVARVAEGERHTLLNSKLGHYAPTPSHRELRDVAELRHVLEHTFGIRLPDADGHVSTEQLNAVLVRCLAKR
ncbi:N-hydroxyarylamine O-acetyltransferase [Paraburkholderia jirisanensis]